MKSVTEFSNFILSQGLKSKMALAAEGKTPEEIQTSLGEKFKFEAEKLTYFMNALEVASQNTESLNRVRVVSLAEGESTPAKATKVEEMHYFPEFFVKHNPAAASDGKGKGKGRQGGGKGGGGGGKESPWGMSPEQKAAKKNAGAGKTKPA